MSFTRVKSIARHVFKRLARNFSAGVTFGLSGPHAFITANPISLAKDLYGLVRHSEEEKLPS